MTKRYWQCLQTKIKRKIIENRKKIKVNETRIDCLIEICIVENVLNSNDLNTNKIVALKYDVMRVYIKSQLFLKLHLSKLRENNDLLWRDCKSNEFDFSTNMRNKSFTCEMLCIDMILIHNYTRIFKWKTNTWEFAKTYVKDLIFRMR